MKVQDYFKDWMKVIDIDILLKTIKSVPLDNVTPSPKNWFKAFELCNYNNLKIIMLGYDPYPQKGVATGILFGNKEGTEMSPSLNIIKEACIDFEVPHNSIIFDPSLESWCKQGILMLNSSLTTRINSTGAHTMIWRPFIKNLISNLSDINTGLIYVLFGDNAKTFKPYIGKYNDVLIEKHPSYYARNNIKMPSTIFKEIIKLVKYKYNEKIKFYEEMDY